MNESISRPGRQIQSAEDNSLGEFAFLEEESQPASVASPIDFQRLQATLIEQEEQLLRVHRDHRRNITRLEAELKTRETAVDQLTLSIQKGETELNQLRSRLSETATQKSRLDGEADHYDRQLREATSEFDKLRESLQSARIAEIQRLRSGFQKQIEGTAKTIREQAAQIANLQATRDRFSKEISALTEERKAYQGQLVELSRHLNEAKEVAKARGEELAAVTEKFNASLSEMIQESLASDQELDQLRQRQSHLLTHIERVKSENETLASKVHQGAMEVRELRAQLTAQGPQVDEIKREFDHRLSDLMRTGYESEAEIKRLRTLEGELRSQLTEAQRQADLASYEVLNARQLSEEKAKSWRQQVKVQAAREQELRSDLKRLGERVLTMENVRAKLMADLAQLREQNQANLNTRENAIRELEIQRAAAETSFKTEAERSREELQAEQNRSLELQRLLKLESEKTQAQAQREEELRFELADINEKLKASSALCIQLEAELSAVRTENETYARDLLALQNTLNQRDVELKASQENSATTIARLEDELRAAQAATAELASEGQDLRVLNRANNEDIASLKDTIDRQLTELQTAAEVETDLRRQFHAKRGEVERLQESLNALESDLLAEIERRREDSVTFAAERSQAFEQIENLLNQIQVRDQDLTEADARNLQLEAKIQDFSAQLNDEQERIRDLEITAGREREGFENERRQWTEQTVDLHLELDARDHNIELLVERLGHEEKKHADESADLRQQIAKLRLDLQQQKAEANEREIQAQVREENLVQNFKAAQLEIGTITAITNDLKAALANEKQAHAEQFFLREELEARLSRQDVALNKINGRIQNQEMEVRRLTLVEEDLGQQLQKSQARASELHQDLQRQKAEANEREIQAQIREENLDRNLKAAQLEIETITNDLKSALANEKQAYSEQVSLREELEARLSRQDVALNKINGRIQNQEMEIRRLTLVEEDLGQQLQKSQARASELSRRSQTAESQLTLIQNQWQLQKAEFETSGQRYSEAAKRTRERTEKLEAESNELKAKADLQNKREVQLGQFAAMLGQQRESLLRGGRELVKEMKAARALNPLKDYMALTEFEIEKLEVQLRKTPMSSLDRPRLESCLQQLSEQRQFLRTALAESQRQLDERLASLERVVRIDQAPAVPPPLPLISGKH